ncbi:MAG: serine/threonine-protein kinase, partial [archaeon]
MTSIDDIIKVEVPNTDFLYSEEAFDRLVQTLQGPKYKTLKRVWDNGTRVCYLRGYGPEGEQERLIKVDQLPRNLTSPRAIRHVGRGYDTLNDIKESLEIEDPDHRLTRVMGYNIFLLKTPEGDFPMAISEEEYFRNSRNLREWVKGREKMEYLDALEARGPLTPRQVGEVMSKVIDCAFNLYKQGFYFRDMNSGAILIRESEEGNLEVKITDRANVCRKDNVTAKYYPTAGSKHIMDPRLIFPAGKKKKYDDMAEVYELGTQLYYALTGEHIFEYDPDEHTGKAIATGESLVDEDGWWLHGKHDEALNDAIQKLPFTTRMRYGDILKRCLSSYEVSRYTSVKELKKAFDKVDHLNFEKRQRRNLWTGASALALMALLMAGNINGQKIQALESKLEEETRTFNVSASWQENRFIIENNLADLAVSGCVKGRG